MIKVFGKHEVQMYQWCTQWCTACKVPVGCCRYMSLMKVTEIAYTYLFLLQQLLFFQLLHLMLCLAAPELNQLPFIFFPPAWAPGGEGFHFMVLKSLSTHDKRWKYFFSQACVWKLSVVWKWTLYICNILFNDQSIVTCYYCYGPKQTLFLRTC